ncbi:hypothetical protein Vretimale_11652 [Volvox reticuliferus]|uniref:Phosphoribulokinase/uridine kinase domain-containing protein n=1 Tax=Volvox reticuliferus TaxID=1737510 RepID=A0A8J4LRS5_9CHLO|nr:hypothetical protein Vretifemale_14728 [Volvox reticuliferus]GIM07570.1 hypothetical protein Vretimale_11652 [Volvox reticuliferus]
MLATALKQYNRPIAPRIQLRRGKILSLVPARRGGSCSALEVAGDTYEDIVEQLAQRVLTRYSARPGRLVVGIAGAPGSGKTTLAAAVADRINHLCGQVADQVAVSGRTVECSAFATVMPMDGFHYYRRELDAMPDPLEAHARRGAPWTFDAAKFVEAVRRVRLAAAGTGAPSSYCCSEGHIRETVVKLPSFDHGVGDPVEDDIVVAADSAVVLVEGNYLLLDQEPWRQLRDLFDETWFVSCPLDLIHKRLFERQTAIGLAPEVSLERIRVNDLPNAELVAACAGAATVLVPGWVPRRSKE